jgi:hypothetical protein
VFDTAWAAGFFDGEGTVYQRSSMEAVVAFREDTLVALEYTQKLNALARALPIPLNVSDNLGNILSRVEDRLKAALEQPDFWWKGQYGR